MHEIVSKHPAVVEVDEQLAAQRDAEDAHRQRAAQQRADYEQRMAEWRGRQQTAVVAGKEPPVQPDPPADERPVLEGETPPPEPTAPENETDAARLLIDRRQQLAQERQATLAEIEPDVVAAALERERELLGEAAEVVERLRPVAQELSELHDAIRAVYQAADAASSEPPVPRRAERMLPRVDVAALVELVDSGGSVLDLRPVEPHHTMDPHAPERPPPPPAEQALLDQIMRDVEISRMRGVHL